MGLHLLMQAWGHHQGPPRSAQELCAPRGVRKYGFHRFGYASGTCGPDNGGSCRGGVG
jgi:hypothetical protein